MGLAMDKGRNGRGFTLVELLVVVAIIALLISILLPSLGVAKQLAQSADCSSNTRSLGMAVQMYVTESNEYYPAAWRAGAPESIAWCGAYYTVGGVAYMDVTRGPLWPYLKQKQITDCPNFVPVKVKYAGSGRISGFGINHQYVAGSPEPDPNNSGMAPWGKPAKASQIRNHAETILFADCGRFKSGVLNEEVFIYPRYKYDGTSLNYATFHFRHRDKANANFCDGHSEAVSPLLLDPAGDGKCGWMANDIMDRD